MSFFLSISYLPTIHVTYDIIFFILKVFFFVKCISKPNVPYDYIQISRILNSYCITSYQKISISNGNNWIWMLKWVQRYVNNRKQQILRTSLSEPCNIKNRHYLRMTQFLHACAKLWVTKRKKAVSAFWELNSP